MFDTHCHLQDPSLSTELDLRLARARQAGVVGLVCCGLTEADWPAVDSVVRRHPEVVPAFGLHPWFLQQRSEGWVDLLAQMLLDWPQAAVGEVGLDFFRRQPSRQVQLELFRAQLELAAAHDRPVSVHCGKAWGPLQELLRAVPVRAVLHSYGGSAELVAPLVRLGAYFSFSGALTDPRRAKVREAARAVPLDRLVVETDAPAASPWRGVEPPLAQPNEPANLVQVVACLAQLRGEPTDLLAQVTAENGRRIFGV